MRIILLFAFLLISIFSYSQPKSRCPAEWKGKGVVDGKSKSEIHTAVMTWALLKIGAGDQYHADEKLGVFKTRTKLPYHIKADDAYMLYDLAILSKDGEINYTINNCYVRRKPLDFWLAKYPPGDDVFDDVFDEINNKMNGVINEIKELTH